ncbi:alpha/beta fold hydrolase, partial [bacterium]|nr:alpha/beta fold hydrolase [bacterium]
MQRKFFSFLIISFFFLFLLDISNPAYANELLFRDDFEDGNANGWEEVAGGENHNYNWEVVQDTDGNFVYKGTVVKECSGDFPSLSMNGDMSWSNYSLSLKIKGIQGVDKVFFVRHTRGGPSYGINIFSNSKIFLGKAKHGTIASANLKTSPQNGWYTVKVTVVEGNIKIFVNGVLHIDYNDPEPVKAGRIALMAWPGAYAGCGGRTTVFFDDISVEKITTSLSPIIIVPGLGASWNTEAILLGIKKPQEEWEMTPFVNIYENLTNTLKENGYQEGKDLFVFNYDWRQPVKDSAQDLANFIQNNIPEDKKVILIGHSLGGLVSRSYWQEFNQQKVKKIITLGSPHQGVVQAYEALAGGEAGDKTSWSSLAANILKLLRFPHYKTNADLFRHEIPVLNDLLPTFDFAKRRKVIPWKKLSFLNNYLPELNKNVNLDKIVFISGKTGKNVTEWIKLKRPTALDKLLGLWPDGRVYKRYLGEGDETVLLKSSYLPGKNPETYPVIHRYLPAEKSIIEKILEELEISGEVSATSSPYPRQNALLFLVASPVHLEIITPQQKHFFSDKNGFVFLPSPAKGNYKAILHGTGEGKYHFIVGQLFPQEKWSLYRGEISPAQEITYQLEINPQNP